MLLPLMSWNSPIDPPIVQNLNIDMSASHFGVWFTVHAPWCIHRASPPPHKTTPSPAHLSLPPFQPTHFISFLCSIYHHSIRTTGQRLKPCRAIFPFKKQIETLEHSEQNKFQWMFLLCLTQAVVRSCNIQTIQIGQKKRKQTGFFKSAAEQRLLHPSI